jgi:NADH:ubiquinone oxidoreductase subunit 3 (subunit A)
LHGSLRCDTPSPSMNFGLRSQGFRAVPGGVRASRLVAPRLGVRMPSLISDYLPLVVFIAIAAAIGGVLLVAPFVVAYKNPDPEKLSAYECGFNPFDDARMKFDVRFYLVSLLFIIFDLEIAFLFPWPSHSMISARWASGR